MLSKISDFVNPTKLFPALLSWMKRYQADLILVTGVVLVSLLAFAAGYITAKEGQKPPIIFQETQNGK